MSWPWPDYVSVINNNRQTGKTKTILDEIHDLAVQGRTAEALVVVPDMRQKEFILRTWRKRWASLTPPEIVSMQNLLPLRGRRFQKIYVENIEFDLEGIYSPRLDFIWPCLVEARDPEVVFTCTPFEQPPWQPAPVEKQRAIRKARKQFVDDVILKHIDRTGQMPKLPDRMMNPDRYEEEGTDQDS